MAIKPPTYIDGDTPQNVPKNFIYLRFLQREGEGSPWREPRIVSPAHPLCGAQTPPRNAPLTPPARPSGKKEIFFSKKKVLQGRLAKFDILFPSKLYIFQMT
jgi:hypothetical protein